MKKFVLVLSTFVLVFGTLANAGAVKFAAKQSAKGAKKAAEGVSYPARHPKKSAKVVFKAAF